jgi:hypothetical protein
MFRQLPVEINWIIEDFLKPLPKVKYNECCKELLKTQKELNSFNSVIIYRYTGYNVQMDIDEISLVCSINYGTMEMGEIFIEKPVIITMNISRLLLLKITNKEYKVPENIKNKPYVFPFKTDNKIVEYYLDVVGVVIIMMILVFVL